MGCFFFREWMCRGGIVGDEACVLLINAPTLNSFGSKSHRQLQETHTHTLGCLLSFFKGLHGDEHAHTHMLGICVGNSFMIRSCFVNVKIHQLSRQHFGANCLSEHVKIMRRYHFICSFYFELEHKFTGSLSVLTHLHT